MVAFAFGLLHGLGFARALLEVGLPEGEVPLALFAFNLGVEAGQLMFIALVLVVGALLGRLYPRAGRQRDPAGRARARGGELPDGRDRGGLVRRAGGGLLTVSRALHDMHNAWNAYARIFRPAAPRS